MGRSLRPRRRKGEFRCDDGAKLSVNFALDCCDREAIGWVASPTGYSSDDVRDLMLERVEKRFGDQLLSTPVQWLSDNGSAYIAEQTRHFAQQIGLQPVTTPVRSPQSNGMAESFVKTIKRDYVATCLVRTAKGRYATWLSLSRITMSSIHTAR